MLKTLDDVINLIIENAHTLNDANVCIMFCKDKKLFDGFEQSATGDEVCKNFQTVVISYYKPSGQSEKCNDLH